MSNTAAFTAKSSLSNIDVVLKPIEEARGLPNEHYISPEVFEEEGTLPFLNWAQRELSNWSRIELEEVAIR